MMAGIKKVISTYFLRPSFSSSRISKCSCSTTTKPTANKSPQLQSVQEKPLVTYGQPSHGTHPHLLRAGEVTPGIRLQEYQERRYRLMESIHKHSTKHDQAPKHHLVVIPSASKVYMTEKIPYVFRQNTDFLYLSGCLEPDSALVLSGGDGDRHAATMFVQKRDAHSELWDGPRTGVDGAPGLFGVDRALPLGEMDAFLTSCAKAERSFTLWYDFMHPVHQEVHNILREFLSRSWNKTWESPKPFIHQLRLYKSPAEIALMKTSCMIASDAIATTIRTSRPGTTEHQMFARVDYECRMRGAEFLAYPPVVASGNRANIIHYINNNQRTQRGDTVLMDAGCEYHGYSSDITRTWPISGAFSPQQKALYEAVLSVQLELIQLCSTLPTLDNLFNSMCTMLGKRLKELGFVSQLASPNEMSRVAYTFCPHHVSHYLGMDVHDTASIPRSINLEPGMIITVEPGIYVNSKNKHAPPEYHGLGVRIEDDVLITENGPVVLTESCPKHIDDIIRLFDNKPSLEITKKLKTK